MADGEYSAKFTGGGNLGDVVKNLAAQLANLKAQIDAVNKASVAPKPAAQKRGANKHKPETAKEAVKTEKQKVEALKKTLAARKEAEKQRKAEHKNEIDRLKKESEARLNEKNRRDNLAERKANERAEEKKQKAEDKKKREEERKAEKAKKEEEKKKKEAQRTAEQKKKADEKANKEKAKAAAKAKSDAEKADKAAKKPGETFKKENAGLVREQNAKAEADAAASRTREMDALKKDIIDRAALKDKAQAKEAKDNEKWRQVDAKANDKKRKHDARVQERQRAEDKRNKAKAMAAEARRNIAEATEGGRGVLARRTSTEGKVGDLRQMATSALRRGDLQGYRAATIEANRLGRSLENVNGLTGILRNSMIRLGTTLAATFGVFQAVRGFTEFVKSGLQFNDTIAKSEIGVAGLITALSDIRNEQGSLLTGAEAFGAAMGYAREQVEALRQDSLRTTASFGELLSTFQVSVGPGLAAGLNLDQVREITVGISQAAAAISLPQNQLAEEVRSLLSGTIQLRTTRIAAVLGITNADVKRWREIGTLSTEINSRLAAFNQASEEAARATLGGVGARLADALSQAAGKASEGLFKTLLDAGNNLFDNVVTIRDELGDLKPNPKFIASFQTLFTAVEKIAKGVIAFVSDLEKLQKIGSFIGTSVTVLFETLSVVIGTLVTIMGGLATVFQAVAHWTGITAAGFGRFLGVVLATVGAMKLLHAVSLGLIGLFGKGSLAALANPWVAALTAIVAIAGALRAVYAVRGKEAEAVVKTNEGLKKQLELQTQISDAKDGDQKRIAKQAKQDALVLADVEKRMAAFATIEASIQDLAGSSGRRQKERLEALRPQQEIDVRTREFLQTRATARDQGNTGTPGSATYLSANRRALAPFEEEIEKQEEKALDKRREFNTIAGSDIATSKNKAELAAYNDLNEVLTLRNNIVSQYVDAQKRLRALGSQSTAQERSQLQAEINGTRDDLAFANEKIERFRLAAARAEAASQAVAAREAAPELREQNRETETRLRTEAPIAGSELDTRSLEILRAEAALIQTTETAKARRLVIDQQIASETATTANLIKNATASEAEALRVNLELKRQGYALEVAAYKQAEKAAALELKRAQLRKTGTFGQGMEQGRTELIDELPTRFEAGVNIMKGTVTSFASFASQMITDAFDPNQDATLSERFGQFFMQIGQMWLEEMIKVRIQAALAERAAKAVKTAGDTASAAATAGAGAAAGGAGGWLSLFSMFASGFSAGGAIGGSGRKGKDSVPIMAAPGEYILNAKAVDKMGLSALDAFNAGDSLSGLSALTGGSAAQSVDPKMGGSAGAARGAAGGSGSGQVVLPVLVSNERQVDQMLRGGKSALGNRVREVRGRRIRD
jgi:hypothetical protein